MARKKSGQQKINGIAFEYACLWAMKEKLQDNQTIKIEENTSFQNSKQAFESLSEIEKENYMHAARTAADIISPLEPNLEHPDTEGSLILAIQADKQGQAGDVRDVLCVRRGKNWEIGLSCKHNHEAVKHSRLSLVLDFGQEWLGYPVSAQYWKAIQPPFAELAQMKAEGMEWKDIENKDQRFYVPILEAFIEELNRIYQAHSEDVPKKLFQYLLGKNDFYKIIAHSASKTTEVKPFNIYGSLGLATKNAKPQYKISVLKLPSKILSINMKPDSKTTLQIFCDNGWELSLRLHNASSKVEASLKFDIQLVGVPNSMGAQRQSWTPFDN